MSVIEQRGPVELSILTNVFGGARKNGSNHDRFCFMMSGSLPSELRFHLLDMKVAHKLEQDQRVVALHTLRTFVGVDIPSAQESGVTEAPPTDWVESRGNLTGVRLERVAVEMADSGGAFQSRGQEVVVDNTEVLEVAGAS